jgi:hypothetical protein
MLAAAPGLALLVIACVWSALARLLLLPVVLVLATVNVEAAPVAMACVWSARARLALVPAAFVVVALSPTAAAVLIACVWLVLVTAFVVLASSPLGVPRVNVRLAVRSPPPVSPLPALTVIAERAMVLSMACVWLVAVTALVLVAVALPGVPSVNVLVAAIVPPPVKPSPAVIVTPLCAI